MESIISRKEHEIQELEEASRQDETAYRDLDQRLEDTENENGDLRKMVFDACKETREIRMKYSKVEHESHERLLRNHQLEEQLLNFKRSISDATRPEKELSDDEIRANFHTIFCRIRNWALNVVNKNDLGTLIRSINICGLDDNANIDTSQSSRLWMRKLANGSICIYRSTSTTTRSMVYISSQPPWQKS